MAQIPSTTNYIDYDPTLYRNAVSSSLLQTLGGSVNGLLDILKRQVLISSSSGSFSLPNNTALTAVTNLSVTITATGRPIFMFLIPDGSFGGGSYFGDKAGSGSDSFKDTGAFFRDSTQLCLIQIGGLHAPGDLCFLDFPTIGTYTYSLRASCYNSGSGLNTLNISGCKLALVEL